MPHKDQKKGITNTIKWREEHPKKLETPQERRERYELNKEKEKEQYRLWRLNNPEKVRLQNERRKKRYHENIEKEREAGRLRHRKLMENETHKAEKRKKVKEWVKQNPEKAKAIQRRYRARKIQVKENYTATDEQYTLELFEYKCFCCGSTHDLCIDHVYPLSAGYALTRKNACVLCNVCNGGKSNKMPEEFYSSDKLTELFFVLSPPYAS